MEKQARTVLLDKNNRVLEPHVCLMGNFDGVHRGHMALVDLAKNLAHQEKVSVGAVTFDPHPRDFFSSPEGQGRRLTPTPLKIQLLHEAGIQTVVIVPFSTEIAEMSGEVFLSFLSSHVTLRHLVVGEDFCFGKNRENTWRHLKVWGESRGVGVTTVPLLGGEEPFSSRHVIQHLQNRELQAANAILGRPYFLQGTVIRGDGRGRQLGFPTANIDCDSFVLPGRGVYAVTAELRGRPLKGVANIGTRPTFNQTKDVVEVHLFGWKDDFYGETLSVSLQYAIRPEKRFASVQDLAAQIQEDCFRAQQLLTD